MKKRLLFKLLTLVALITSALSANAYDFESGGFYYDITGSNTVSLTHSRQYSSDYSGDVTVPSNVTHGGVTYTVTGISNSAFYLCENMTSVTLPSTVTTIDESAFYYCTGLTQVSIPESVTEIGNWNFYMSEELIEVTLPSTLNSMGYDCFGFCAKLTKVTCKATTPPTIGTRCFSSDSEKTLYVPESAISAYQDVYNWSHWFNSVQAIPDYDFTYMNLKFVITSPTTAKCVGCTVDSPSGTWSIPETANGYRVTEIGYEAFFFCDKITTINIGRAVQVIGEYAFYGCSAMTNLNLGNVTSIKDCAFGDCSALTQVTIPSSVTFLGFYAFGGTGLTTVTIPATVLTIREEPFNHCPALTAINVASDNPNYTSLGGVLFNKDMTELICYPEGKSERYYTVPEGVTKLCTGAFGYSQLQNVNLPSTLESVDYLAFAYNSALTNVTCLAHTPPTLGSSVFVSTIDNSGLTLKVPRDCQSAYQAAYGWSDFPTIQEKYYDFSTGLFYYNITSDSTVEVTCDNENGGTYQNYLKMTVPPSVYYGGKYFTVTAIGAHAFDECRNIQKLELPSTITIIGYDAFYYCTGLTDINLPEGLKTIDTYAFYYCNSLDSVQIPSSVTWIGTYAFCGCSSLTEFTIPPKVKTVGYGAFYDCTNMTTITIGGSVQSIGDKAFYRCSSLNKVICHSSTPPTIQSNTFDQSHYSSVQLRVPKNSLNAYKQANYWKNFTSISGMSYDFEKDGVFYNITGTSPATVEVTYMTTDYNSYSGVVNIPATVTNDGTTYTVTCIGYSAFRMSKSLTAVTIPNTVTTIAGYAFYWCEGLTNVIIPNSVTSINNNAFWICRNLKEIIIPNSVTTVGSFAFRNCTAATRVVIGKNVTSIGETCFIYCPNITEVTCLAETPPSLYESSSNVFDDAVYQNAVLHVPYGSHNAYLNHPNWEKFTHIVSCEVIDPASAGDVNGDGRVNISDVTTLINFLLSHDDSGINLEAANVNGDAVVNISDVTSLINILLGGPAEDITGGTGKSNFLINNVGFTMVKVSGGTFTMGDNGSSLSLPFHEVTVSDYCIGETEVTQLLWQTVMGNNPSSNKSNLLLPVENMSWDDCQEFTTELSRLTGQNFRLPTEAEWEFAARGGNKSQGYTYAGSNTLDDVAWYQDNSGNKTHIVGSKAPNELGLFDMSGNVFEWIQDYWGDYTSEAQIDPQGPGSSDYRVCRSSSFCRPNNNNWFKCGGRTCDSPNNPAYDTGLRLACGTYGELQSSSHGQTVNDHLFVRMQGADNEVTIGNNPVRVMFWLDDDQIYTNQAVQALTPMAYNEQGDLYNEITYCSTQFDLYVPQNLEIVTKDDGSLDITPGDRMPNSSYLGSSLTGETKVIDGVLYNRYVFMVYNTYAYGTHFSGTTPEQYAINGALKKDDAALLGINFRRVPGMDAPTGDEYIIIANTIFGVMEAIMADWSYNEFNFVYGSGGNIQSPLFQKYVRVKVK